MIKNSPLGIDSSGYEYHILPSNNDTSETRLLEFIKTDRFLASFREEAERKYPQLNLKSGKVGMRFINWGHSQLVYALSTETHNWTVLVSQPTVKKGFVKKEYDNLQRLASINSEIAVKPECYFTDGERELYVTPYFFQARCISNLDEFGVFVPEPEYDFIRFSKEERFAVNSSMIASLIRLYDERKGQGLGTVQIHSGDFILEREWSVEPKTIENTLKRMRLIAARELIDIPFDEYLELLRKEFVRNTYKNNEGVLVNSKSTVPMTREEIETGIEVGTKLKNR